MVFLVFLVSYGFWIVGFGGEEWEGRRWKAVERERMRERALGFEGARFTGFQERNEPPLLSVR